jgi:hypothetical protein
VTHCKQVVKKKMEEYPSSTLFLVYISVVVTFTFLIEVFK